MKDGDAPVGEIIAEAMRSSRGRLLSSLIRQLGELSEDESAHLEALGYLDGAR